MVAILIILCLQRYQKQVKYIHIYFPHREESEEVGLGYAGVRNPGRSLQW